MKCENKNNVTILAYYNSEKMNWRQIAMLKGILFVVFLLLVIFLVKRSCYAGIKYLHKRDTSL